MKKRLLSALCAVMLLICAVPMASAQTGDAARRADALTVLHLLSEDPSRDLTKPATRAQAAVLLVRLAGGEKKPDTDGWFAGFRDVPDWARTAVNYANRRGWISGVSNVQFDPNGHLNADAWCAMLLRMLGYSDKTGDFEISDAAAFAWRIGLTGRQLIGILSMGDLAEAIYDALDFCYKGTETTVLSRLMDLGVCTASAANALGLLNKDYTARQLADRYLPAAFQLLRRRQRLLHQRRRSGRHQLSLHRRFHQGHRHPPQRRNLRGRAGPLLRYRYRHRRNQGLPDQSVPPHHLRFQLSGSGGHGGHPPRRSGVRHRQPSGSGAGHQLRHHRLHRS